MPKPMSADDEVIAPGRVQTPDREHLLRSLTAAEERLAASEAALEREQAVSNKAWQKMQAARSTRDADAERLDEVRRELAQALGIEARP